MAQGCSDNQKKVCTFFQAGGFAPRTPTPGRPHSRPPKVWPLAGCPLKKKFKLFSCTILVVMNFYFQFYFTISWKFSNRITSQLPWFYSTFSREFSNRITAPAANLMQGPRTQLWQWFYFYSTIPRECWNRITSKCLDSIQTFPGNCWIELLLVPKTVYQSNFTEAVCGWTVILFNKIQGSVE